MHFPPTRHHAQRFAGLLSVLVMALHSGVLNKLSELAGFLLRSQLTRAMRDGSGLLDLVKLARGRLGAAP